MCKSEVTTINKVKKFNISLNIAHFFKKKFLQSLIPTCAMHCVNIMVLLYLAFNMETFFKKCDFLEKLILSFFFKRNHPWNVSKACNLNQVGNRSRVFFWDFGEIPRTGYSVGKMFLLTLKKKNRKKKAWLSLVSGVLGFH